MKDITTKPVFQSAIKVGDVLALVTSDNGVIAANGDHKHIGCVEWMLKTNEEFAGAYLGAYAPRVAKVVANRMDPFDGRVITISLNGMEKDIYPHREEILEVVE